MNDQQADALSGANDRLFCDPATMRRSSPAPAKPLDHHTVHPPSSFARGEMVALVAIVWKLPPAKLFPDLSRRGPQLWSNACQRSSQEISALHDPLFDCRTLNVAVFSFQAGAFQSSTRVDAKC